MEVARRLGEPSGASRLDRSPHGEVIIATSGFVETIDRIMKLFKDRVVLSSARSPVAFHRDFGCR